MAMTLMALAAPVAQRFVPSSGSTAISISRSPGWQRPTRSPMKSMGAWSRSPSPITTSPLTCRSLKALRMASTAAWSAPFRSPRPMSRPEASAAASVMRATSRARLRSMISSLGSSGDELLARQEPVEELARHALDPPVEVHARMHGVAGGEQLLAPQDAIAEPGRGPPRLGESGLHPDQIVVAGRRLVGHLGVHHREPEPVQFLEVAVAQPLG